MTGELKRLGGRLDRCESATATSSEPEIDGSGGQKVDLDLEDFGQPSATSMPEAAGQMEKPATGTAQATMAQQVAQLTANVTRIEKFCAEPLRKRQLQAEDQCDVLVVSSMLAVCCSTGGVDGSGHRRQLQGGCSSFPPNCTPTCAVQFVPLYEGCPSFRDQIAGVGGERFFASCNEAATQAAAMNRMQPVEVRMYRISVSSSEAAGNQAGMFLPDGGSTDPTIPPIIGPLPELPTPGDGQQGGSSTDVEQYHAQCTTANILTCVPACNATTHGYELLATIDGTDTKFSCNLANLLYSWVGAAALGGYLGRNAAAFLSAVISGAAGTFMLTLREDADFGVGATGLLVHPGQNVHVHGDPALTEAPAWSTEFEVESGGSLTLRHVSIRRNIQVRGELFMAGVQMTIDSAVYNQAATVTIGSTTSAEFIEYTYTGPNAGQYLPDDPNIGSGADTLTIRASSDRLSQCDLPYETIIVPPTTCKDANNDDLCIPSAKKPGARWFRIVGADNVQRRLATHVCGTGSSSPHLGWLSGVALDHPNLYSDTTAGLPAGTIPSEAEGTMQRVICVEDYRYPEQYECSHALQINIVNCGEYDLWQLPNMYAGGRGYCLEQ